jgi:hypothetical protein
MAKYVMISYYGNEIKEVDSERERKELEALGFKEVEKETPNINEMTVAKLEAFAKEEGIDLSECKNKTEKLEKIKNIIEQ